MLGRPQADVEADLKALKIKYALYPLVNDGSYVAGTVARSDTDKGTVVESGTHDELIADAHGLYHSLSSLQLERA